MDGSFKKKLYKFDISFTDKTKQKLRFHLFI